MCDSFGQKATAAGQSHPPRFYNFVTGPSHNENLERLARKHRWRGRLLRQRKPASACTGARTPAAFTWSTRNQGQAPAACTSTEDGKVHMANGVHISGEAYTTLMVTQKSSMFCKK
ncbi:uncharacterized protein LOC144115279 isoform X1 [Amblyomma americanum]